MNTTSTDSVGLSPVLIALRTCFVFIIALLIISGNILSIAVTRRVTNLADSTKALMTSLAVFDLLVGVLALFSVAASALDRWPFGEFACKLVALCATMFLVLSVTLIAFLNIERFIAVTRPYKFPLWCTANRVVALVLVVLMSTLSFCVVLILELHSPTGVNTWDMCFYMETSTLLNILSMIIADILPTAMMSFIYYRLIKISRRHEQRLNQNVHNEANNIHENKALKTFLVVTLTFAGCYTPVLILRIVGSLSSVSPPDWLEFLTLWLMMSNSMFNVIIYCLFNKAFRLCKIT